MGPDLDAARQKGRKVGEAYLAKLIKENHLDDDFFVVPMFEKNWKKAKKKFVEAVEELFVEDACNGF